MVDPLTEELIAECKEAFSLFDKAGVGTIKINDLGVILRYLGHSTTESELRDIIEVVDPTGSDTIDFPQFLSLKASMHRKTCEEEVIAAFQIFDKNNSGLIPAAELRKFVESLGEKLTDDEANEMLNSANIDRDGMINYEDFVRSMM